jgi:hypothetical protein
MTMFLAATAVQGQITISGNVYGGGNAGNLGGSTNVRIYAADITGNVYGGARQADIAGCAYVNIDGEHMSGDIIINHVYGGNDVSGNIGSLEAIGSSNEKPDDRLDAGGHHSTTTTEEEQHDDHGSLKNVNTFILTTAERKETTGTGDDAVTTQPYHIFVGSLFGSGNGDYTYTTNADDADKWDVVVGGETIRKIDKPEAARSYVDIHGGTFGYVYAGGNNASVTTSANICINNSSSITKVSANTTTDTDEGVVVKSDRLLAMGINTDYYHNNYLFSRVFGGNNKAEMKIRPTWHLTNGSIEYLYSGGDEGAMTSPDGILLVVKPDEGGNLRVRNVFAGCRKAPVTPKSISSGEPVIPETVEGYKFPRGLAARVLIYGGDIYDVYGGNDITGQVTGGSAIGIYHSIKGCVYGGGNGSYAYTDNPALKDSPLYGDFYYDVDKVLGLPEGTFAAADATQKSFMSANALKKYRPNAEQVSLRVYGGDPDDENQEPTVIGGAIYLGGNSATLLPTDKQKQDGYMIQLKIGSNVISDSVFLANNGASMVTTDILKRYCSTVTYNGNSCKYSQMNFLSTALDGTDLDETGNGKNTFAKYMDGVVMEAGPQVVFDNEVQGDPATYKNYSTQFGSFYCGGNVGSMRNNATTTINVDYPVVIFEKLVGGSNKAYVPASDYNLQYKGGLLGTPPTTGENAGVKLKLNLTGVKIQPKRWKLAKNNAGEYYKDDKGNYVKEVDPTTNIPTELEWNTISAATGNPVSPVTTLTKDEGKDYETSDAADMDRRLKGGNIYGGCYESGRVNGNVVINVNGSIIDRDGKYGVFDTVVGDTLGEAILYGHDSYQITERRSGVILDEQGMDVYGRALNLFGGGYGANSEIWGSTTINVNKGYIFQIFGGSELGVIGKSREDKGEATVEGDYDFNGKHFAYDDHYSTTINLHGEHIGASKQDDLSEDLAEAEFIYGGGFEGPIIGNTRINLGNGRVFNTFAGSCNADILGHTETYIGQWTVRVNDTDNTITGFPWVRDYTYGGNDLGGTIMGSKSFKSQLNEGTLEKVYGYRAPKEAVDEEPADPGNTDPEVLTASAYTEYKQGYVGGIFGGCYGDYDYQVKYKAIAEADKFPYIDNAFVNISPLNATEINKRNNYIGKIFGAGQGHSGERRGDNVQNRSYVLIDIPTGTDKFQAAEVFGAGSNNGLGMKSSVAYNAEESAKDAVSTIVDLVSGKISAVYGGSYNEGVTRRTLVNVPAQSAININNIFGGAYGTLILPPCDVYEANVNYKNTSEKATVTGAIYGGNNNERRALYTKVNISSPVWSNKDKGYTATVYGAGKGVDTWSEYTEVNLENGAKVYEVYGGGQLGHVLNAQSVQTYMTTYKTLQKPSPDIAKKDPKWSQKDRWTGDVGTSELKTEALKTEWLADWKNSWTLGSYYIPNDDFDNYVENTATNFTNVTARPELDNETAALFGNADKKFNTHVIIKKGAVVDGYAYGGGLGVDTISLSGDTYAMTYIALLGGMVKKDIYAAGTSGGVYNLFGAPDFTASANAYIEGGMLRNVYGGGWKGNVGLHTGAKVNGTYYDVAGPTTGDIPAETNVVIGIHQDKASSIEGYGFYKGNPAIMRNAYGGGEGGAVFGTANLTLRNGQIGYIHLNDGEKQNDKGEIVDAPARPEEPEEGYVYPYSERYEAKINDETYYNKQPPYEWLGEGSLEDAGCVFGGGYIDNSTVDVTNVKMYGGHIRNSLFGGGEIAAIGRGLVTVSTTNSSGRSLTGIYKAGKTNVWLFEGNIDRNLFGGGRGTNNLGDHGSLNSDGFVFGQTKVHVFGGVVGTAAGVAKGDGNVFGGGDVGYVYSAFEKTYEDKRQLYVGIKDGERYDDHWEGYYYGYRVGDKEEGNVYGTYIPGTKPADNDPRWDTDGGEYILTEDCKVLVEPHPKATGDVTIGNNSYAAGDYIETDILNTLSAKTGTDAATWSNIDATGIIIHNAVFAGGNTSTGSSTAHANTPSVFGNATASIHDVYHRDLITLGTGHTGGLYGDGNLTLVDGYRELNITNYGTDYYSIKKEITIEEYHGLPDRENAYYELRYTCLKTCTDKDGTTYSPKDPDNENSKASTITADDLLTLFLVEDSENPGTYLSYQNEGVAILINDSEKGWIPNPNNGDPFWEESGVLPVYAGRLMNSIQRADFCGVFGSRMVMQGARDRVPEITDFTNYTINRVREVSLNQQHSQISTDLVLKTGVTQAATPEDQDPDDYVDLEKAIHGNYFGIYNIVNYLGALTSDVHFSDKRRTDNTDTDTYGPEKVKDEHGNLVYELDGVTPKLVGDDLTYYRWKSKHIKDRTRNNGTSFNKVALASGVYLELTSEKSTGKELNEKDWGYITGIIELDLINVQTGIGGGFVYAKNEHRPGTSSGLNYVTLTDLNNGAVSKRNYKYENSAVEWETSGNFVHSTQTIIDDCYNISGKYEGNDAVPAHYWYIKGSVYVYDQYISAYTGASNAYSETVDIPLTISAASHGTMKLLNVQPNLYAYYVSQGVPLQNDKKIIINDVTYYKNDPISYWDWYLLSKPEQALFVSETYVTIADCKIEREGQEDVVIPAGTVMLPGNSGTEGTYEYYKNLAGSKQLEEGGPTVKYVHNTTTDKDVTFDFVFRSSNNLSHDTGYILTYKVNNPTEWNTWYTKRDDSDSKNQTGGSDYEDSPTYRLKATTGGEVLGQREYEYSNLISKEVEDEYQKILVNTNAATWVAQHVTNESTRDQATFEPAYIVTNEDGISAKKWNYGYVMNASEVATKNNDGTYTVKSEFDGNVAPAYICTSTIQMDKTEFVYLNSTMSLAEKNDYISRVESDMDKIASGASSWTASQISSSPLTDAQKMSLNNLLTLKQDLDKYIQPAYYCVSEDGGSYGGRYYASGVNYRGLEAWSSMSQADREKFIFNYDALDLLIDPKYSTQKDNENKLMYPEGKKYQYDGATLNGNTIVPFTTEDQAKTNDAGYSITQPVDYTATYSSETSLTLESGKTVMVKHANGTEEAVGTITKGDELKREAFESLPNERRHYTGIVVGDEKCKLTNSKYEVYVVNTPFQVGNTPYAVGTILNANTYTGDMTNITTLKFNSSDNGKTYYYCRERYQIGENGSGVRPEVISSTVVDGAGGGIERVEEKDYVKVGTIIVGGDGTGQYGNLPNQQGDFVIHGISPTETSTFYVSRESDIFDLSTEKIITVVYEYDYEESDKYGNITPVSERHVVNIHINFKSGVPSVEDIKAPQLVLPGTKVGLREPNVTPGAYEVTGGGWELFRTITEAESHVNGMDYTPATDFLYWYQNDYYVAYYAKTYLGKTYSNHVQVSVANYHDLKKVMEAMEHHYYIDNEDVDRAPKIYINDYSKDATGSKNGLDLLKDLYDLSLETRTYDDDGDPVPIASGKLEGHIPMEDRIMAGAGLEFFLRTNIDHSKKTISNPAHESDPSAPETITVDDSWNPIGSGSDPCFSGVLHGDGYYISGLDHSLFDKLCGQVYNLGVTGSFTGAGIAETGEGYVENCWVKTSAMNAADAPENTPVDKILQTGAGHYAVFGNPSRTGSDLVQVVNCYYPESNAYTEPTGAALDHGKATKMPDKAFYNGEVAYDLNGFYLKKRYYDNNSSWTGGNQSYKYLKANADGTLPEEMTEGNYLDTYACYPLDADDDKKVYGYVENRFADGDYIYAGGTIPETVDMRSRTVKELVGTGDNAKEEDVTYYTPIWPDDYVFFGQALNYSHMDGNGGRDLRTHQDVPSRIVKSSDRIATDVSGNRVYRAPAYFRNSKMGVAHFNPHAVFAATKKGNAAVKAYEDMTAIDFTGYNDVTYDYLPEWQKWSKTSQTPQSTEKSENAYAFYPPLLDDGGVRGFYNADLTQNLLVYTCVATDEGNENDACNVTDATISSALHETPYAEGDATGLGYVAGKTEYRTVAINDPVNVKGHWVQKSGSGDYMALRDHQLVDKQDFNAPMRYTFDSYTDNENVEHGYRMWYQRNPDNFAGQEKDMDENGNPVLRSDAGWESISLPFAAELVTTNVKGEITHFYSGSATADNDEGTDHTKKGHEYWLREYKGKVEKSEDVYVALFNYPTAVTSGENSDEPKKTVYNTFLWDYYYKAETGHNQLDKNKDTYQTYYNESREYKNYPQLQGGTPYIIGFPGARYYEFDLSGNFEAYPTTATYQDKLPSKLSKQTITFASNPGAEIEVSDKEMNENGVLYDGYRFYPNYLNIEMPAGGYVMSKDGDAFNKLTADDVTAKKNKVSAFRTYFSTSATPQMAARRIVFSRSTSSLGGGSVEETSQDNVDESLDIRSGKHKIIVTSNLRSIADVRIVNVAGMTINSFSIEPGETVETRIYNSGVYIVQTSDARYTKKLAVR